MNKLLLLALVLTLCCSVSLTGCNTKTGNEQAKDDSKKKEASDNTPTKKTDSDKAEDKKKEEEVVYKGKSLDQWLKQLSDRDMASRDEAVKAVIAIRKKGDDRIPLALLDCLNSGDYLTRKPRSAFDEITQAFGGLARTDFDTAQKVSAFTKVMERKIDSKTDDWFRQQHVCELIEGMDEKNKEPYAPLLIAFLKRKKETGQKDEDVSSLQVRAADALAKCATAKQAPEIIEVWRQCPYEGVKGKLGGIIRGIDPEAAKKAGI
jgi:hypothetical protein